MIVVRIQNVNGSCRVDGYDRTSEKWFPVENVSFGFDTDKLSDTDDLEQLRKEILSKTIQALGTKSREDRSELSFSKITDSATCDLMYLAMQDRLKVKGEASDMLTADVHFLEIIDGTPTAYLKIALENVLIKSWNIDGSGDDRPTESVTLEFDKCALQYLSSTDGKTFSPAGQKGWDQIANESWTPANNPYFS